MNVEKLLIILRTKTSLTNVFHLQEREYKSYKEKVIQPMRAYIQNFTSLTEKGFINLHEQENGFPANFGKIDLLIIEDDYRHVSSIYLQAGNNEKIRRVVVIDHPSVFYWLIKQKIPVPRLVTLDFHFGKEDEKFQTIQVLYRENGVLGVADT